MPLVEQSRHAIGLADLLLYDSLIEDGILLLQDGGLLAAWKFQGPDLGSATNGEMAALSGRLGSLLRLGGGWMVQCDSVRGYAFEGYTHERQCRQSGRSRRTVALRASLRVVERPSDPASPISGVSER